MKPSSTPVTETPNELTLDLDIAEPAAMARLLRQSDAQLFAGWRGLPAFMDDHVLVQLAATARATAKVLAAGKRGVVLLSGAGTSGRFAALVSREFNRLLKAAHRPPVFRPLIAGGYPALVKAQEGAEDDPVLAMQDLRNNLPADVEQILYVGITCGFSAPYVGAQLDHLNKVPQATNVLLGFNPLTDARRTKVENWDKTFGQVIDELAQSTRFIPLNPIYGPEAVMGSTRMKGGSATKIALEVAFHAGLELAGVGGGDPTAPSLVGADDEQLLARLREYLRLYRDTIAAVYEQTDTLAALIRLGGATLRSGGKVNYLGRETAGILGIIDATECPPTFGATFEDVRGFLRDGWPSLLDEQHDLSANGPEYKIDLDWFEEQKLPKLERGDLVLGIAVGELGPRVRQILEKAESTKATTGVLLVTATPPRKDDLPGSVDHRYILRVPALGFRPGHTNLAELALKLALNALSTGAHVLIGKVYQNRMIDLRISNQKLYYRAIGTIEKLAACDTDTAKLSLHRAAFRKDRLTKEELEAPPSTIIKTAAPLPRVVPTALLLALASMTVDEARQLLIQDPVARRVLKKTMETRRDSAVGTTREEG